MSQNENIVSCDYCGVVFDKTVAADWNECPVCETTVRKTTPMPGLGRVHKWWSEVEA